MIVNVSSKTLTHRVHTDCGAMSTDVTDVAKITITQQSAIMAFHKYEINISHYRY